jgi:hypothetical protein
MSVDEDNGEDAVLIFESSRSCLNSCFVYGEEDGGKFFWLGYSFLIYVPAIGLELNGGDGGFVFTDGACSTSSSFS